MTITEMNELLYQRYQLNKQIMQTIRRYPELIIINRQLPSELSYVERKLDWLNHQYFRVVEKN